MKKSRLAALLLILVPVSLLLCAFTKGGPFPELMGYRSTMNFSVWAPTQEKADMVADELEEYYSRFISDLKYGGMLKKKPEVYVFKDYEEYVDKTGTVGYNTSHTGGIAVPRSARKPAKIYFFIGKHLSEVLQHELTHVLFKEMTAGLRTDARIPAWLAEGIAVYESRGHQYKARVTEALRTGRTIPTAEVVGSAAYPEDRDKISLFYAQSASLVDFLLNQYGGVKFLAFSTKLIRGGKTIDEALSSTYYPHIRNVSQLNDAWLNFQKQQ